MVVNKYEDDVNEISRRNSSWWKLLCM